VPRERPRGRGGAASTTRNDHPEEHRGVRVATWNVNDIRKRLPQLLDWLQRTAPDVVALQELKASTADFPVAALAAAGYAVLVVG